MTDDVEGLRALLPALQALAQGGTAVGTGVNAHAQFASCVCADVDRAHRTRLRRLRADSLRAMGAQDTAVALSGRLQDRRGVR